MPATKYLPHHRSSTFLLGSSRQGSSPQSSGNPIIPRLASFLQRRVTAKPDEDAILKQVSQDVRRTHNLSEDQKQVLSNVFEKRLTQALALVESRNVTSHQFKPSGRTVWIVKGRKSDYQVMPESMFCTCDDYYFRVMDNKKQLCYHLVAQQLAEAIGKFEVSEMSDSRYTEVTAKWNSRSQSRRS